MNDRILVREEGRVLTFRYPMLLAFHGGGFPGGVVHGLKAMQAAFPLLDERLPERRRILVATAFHGPGGRDAIEAVTRAATDGRLTVNCSIGAAGDVIVDPPGPYVFRFTLGLRTVEAAIRPGHVREDFVRLGAKTDRTPSETAEHERLKREMAMRLLPLRGDDVYAVRLVQAVNERAHLAP